MDEVDDAISKRIMKNHNISEEQMSKVLQKLVDDGLLEEQSGGFRLTSDGIDYVEDKILGKKK